MDDELQPEYCDCHGFHDGSCKYRRIKVLEKLCIDLEEALTVKEKRIKILENTCESVYKILNDSYMSSTTVQKARFSELSDVVEHALQDLGFVLHNKGAKEHRNGK